MDQETGVVAVHYIFMIKDDEDLPQIWSSLTGGGTIAAEPFSLDLGSGKGKRHSRGCSIVSRSSGDGREVCLGMLPDLAAIEVVYRSGDARPESRWAEVLEHIDADRKEALAGDVTVMGESTVLVTGERPADSLTQAVETVFPSSHLLLSEIDPAIAGGEKPHWGYVLGQERRGRDYFILAAEKARPLIETLLPEADSYIKKLNKTAKYFAHQRQTIIKERLKVDKDVGAILHEQVVSGNGSYEPEKLEEEIASLSRMFGVLATDSQLVRQAAEQIEKDIHRLEYALSPILISDGARDEISQHLTNRYKAEHANARIESDNLDFSRQSAQAAIEVVRTQVDLLRAGEEAALQAQTKKILDRSLLLQEERMALQVAAGFIEFVLVFYYTLKSWEGIAGHEAFEHVPPLLRLFTVAFVSASVTLATHELARTIKHRRLTKGVVLALTLWVGAITALVIETVYYS